MNLTIYSNFREQALYDALMRQDELLAYIDRQELIKFRVRYCTVLPPFFLTPSFDIYK